VTNPAPLVGISVGSIKSPVSGAPYLAVRPTYTHAVEQAEGAVVMIPLRLDGDGLRRIYERLDGIVLSGGGDVDPQCYGAETVSPYTMGIDPDRDELELRLVRWAIADNKPLLCICRGIQVLNVALGGTLIQDIREEVPGALRHEAPSDDWFTRMAHEVTVSASSQLHAALAITGERLAVNSLHHQALGAVALDLTVVAHADDGIVEGVQIDGNRFTLGVQWHPEALVDDHPHMQHLFGALVEAARG
jgi:putative glutamine amidotransferase